MEPLKSLFATMSDISANDNRVGSLSYDKVCALCRTRFAEKRSGDANKDHFSILDFTIPMLRRKGKSLWMDFRTTKCTLKDSSDQGCHFCSLLYNSIFCSSRFTVEDEVDIVMPRDTSRSKCIGVADIIGQKKILNPEFAGSKIRDQILLQRYMASSNDESFNAKVIRKWASKCLSKHSSCKNNWKLDVSERRLPSRLINVSLVLESTVSIRLVTTATIPKRTRYVTLSHCWGSKQPLTLTSENFKQFCQSIPWDRLPPTFRDAIRLTHALRLKYIWIDSLCIIQDSKEDWDRESERMGEIYSQSFFTIAATSAADSTGGLYNNSSHSLSNQGCLLEWRSSRFRPQWLHVYPRAEELWEKFVDDAPLGKRGWVMQERLLSARILHFTSCGLFWECCEGMAVQWIPSKYWLSFEILWKPIKTLMGDKSFWREVINESTVYSKWHDFISRYTLCALTVPSDKLIAFSAIARRVARQLGVARDGYLAGLWKANLLNELQWYAAKPDQTRLFPERAPSWSWAYIDGEVKHEYNYYQHVPTFRLLKSGVYPVSQSGDPFGRLSGGFLLLQGPLIQMKITRGIRDFKWSSSRAQTPVRDSWFSDRGIKLHVNDSQVSLDSATINSQEEDEPGPGDPYFFILARFRYNNFRTILAGLILQPTGQIRGQYRRVGIARHYSPEFLEENGMVFTVRDAMQIIERGRNPNSLDERYFRDKDAEKGFIIEII